MKKLSYQDEYVDMYVDIENSQITDIWKQKSATLDADGFLHFKSILFKFKELIEENQLKFALTDTRLFFVPLNGQMQDWITENIIMPISTNPSIYIKHAFLASEEFISKLSLEQLVDQGNKADQGTQILYFDDLAKAQHWLNS